MVDSLPPSAISGNTTICRGESTTLTATGGGTYQWSTGDTTASITVSPTSTTTYTVTVTIGNTCTASASATVTVNPLPTASISGDSIICEGDLATLTAMQGDAYLWSTGDSTATIVVSPATTTSYSVTVSNNFGCSASASTTVIVLERPVASITGKDTLCQGSSTILTASGGVGYHWSTGATTSSITVSPNTTTTYTVTVTASNGCTSTASRTVVVHPLPLPSVSGNNVICKGDSTALTASGGTTYHWSTGANTATIVVAPSSNTTYTVTVTDANGCTASTSISVIVNQLPVASVSGDTSLCEGQSTVLIASGGIAYAWNTGANTAAIHVTPPASTVYSVTVTGSNGCTAVVNAPVNVHPWPDASIAGDTVICLGDATTLTAAGADFYLWSTGDTTAAITVAPAVETTYSVTVTTQFGCYDSASVTVHVDTLPVAVITGVDTICFGDTTTLTASGGTTYLWNTGDTTASIAVAPSSTSTYSVTVTDGNGCTGSAGSTVVVHPLPVPSISGDTTICRRDTAELIASGGGSYLWSTGDSTAMILVSPDSTTTYSVTVTNQYGCTASASHLLTVEPLPPAMIAGGPYHCDGDSTTLTASGGVSYLWSTGATTASIVVSPSVNTTYGVLVTGANGCQETASVTLEVQYAQEIMWADTICQGDTLYFFGQALTASGTYRDTAFYASGCDSIRYTLDLYVHNQCTLDLALRKTLGSGQAPIATLFDTVTFTVTVFNQDTIPAWNIHIIDYVQPGFSYYQALNPGWFDFGAGPAWIIPGPLQPGDSISQDIRLVVNLEALDTSLLNFAEITFFDNDTISTNTPPTDPDSNPDAFNGNDAGGQPGSPADDYLFGDGTGTPGDGVAATDEDDHDGASVQFLPPPPLSLGNQVFIDLDNDGLFNNNDPGLPGVTVELYNAGPDGLKGTGDDFLVDTTVTDANGQYLFTGLSHGLYRAKLNGNGIPPGYTSSTGDGPQDMDGQGPFEPAYGAFLDLDNADDGTQMGSMIMTDTIRLFYWSEPTFEDGDENTNLTLDFGLFSPSAAVFDLALSKRLADGQPNAVDINDDVDYTICVVNQGNVTAYNVQLYDIIPAGMILSPADNNGWTLLSQDTAVLTITDPIAIGDTICVNFKLRVVYAASGVELVNKAEISHAEDVEGNQFPDVDSTPDNGDPDEDDLDVASVNILPHDPTGYIYCEESGEIITGGTVSVTGPGTVYLVADGSNGYYEFYTDGTPGIYTITYNHPQGYPLSTTCLPMGGAFDPTGMPDPVALGSDTLAGNLADASCGANPYYLAFDYAPGDPLVTRNNLPVRCVSIGAIVCEDVNLNDSIDAADQRLAGMTVYLYDCADTLNPIATTTSDSLGRYSFTGLPAGNYRVRFELPAGYRPVSSGSIAPNGYSPCLTLDWGDRDSSANLCLYLCPEVMAGPDVTICLYDTTALIATVSHGSGDYSWSPTAGLSHPDSAFTLAYPQSTTTYVVAFDDGNGCVSTDSVVVYTQISIPARVNAPDTAFTVECGQPYPWWAPRFTDLCDSNLVILFDSTMVPRNCGYDLVRTWTAVNKYDQTATFQQVVHVIDTTPPVFTYVPADTTLASCTDMANMNAMATDNCDTDVEIIIDETLTGGPNCQIVVTRTYTAVDDCGNSTTATQVITTYDTEAPSITVTNPMLSGLQQGDTLYLECQVVGNLGPDDVTVTDDCGGADVIFEEFDGPLQNCPSAGFVQFLRCGWTATDMCGNQDSLFFFVVVIDTTPPQLFTVPADITLMCNDPVPPAPTVLAVDNCDNNVPVTFSETTSGGQLIRTWTATDDCGNTIVGTQTITYDDGSLPPVLYGIPADTTIRCEDPVPAPDTSVWALDACDPDPTIVVTDSIADEGCGYRIYRTWTATDFDGNSSSATQLITVIDDIPPVLSGIPSDITIECGQPLPPVVYPAVSDNCDTSVTVDLIVLVNDQDSCNIVVNRIFTATDDCGNQAGFHQHIHLVDTTAPVITVTHPQLVGVPSGDTLTFECDAVPILEDGDAYATDGCDAAPIVYRTETVLAQPLCQTDDYLYLMRCGWVAQDRCGNESEWYVFFRVVDTQAPVISGTLPPDVTVDCGNVPPPPDLNTLAVSDNCDTLPALSLTDSILTGACPGSYTILRTLTATDHCGNVSSVTQTITVRDITPPVLSGVPSDVTVDCGDIPPPAQVTAVDNCDTSVLITMTDVAGSGCPYTIFRTWTATDGCGNSSSRTQRITVRDTIPPAFDHLPADTVVDCSGVPPADTLLAIDNCDTSLVVTFGETVTGSGCNYTITRTWTATDDCSNTYVHVQTIQVIDDEPPVLSHLPADLTVVCGSIPPVDTITATDNCDPSPQVQFAEVRSGSCPYTLKRTWTATDACGNTSTHVQTITVVDTLAPVLTGVPADTTVLCGSLLPDPVVEATDDCDSTVQVQLVETIDSSNLCDRVLVRTWTATDACGNSTTASQTIHLIDTVPPLITFNHPWLAGLQHGDTLVMDCSNTEVFGLASASASDDCNGAVLAFTEGNVKVGDCASDGFIYALDCKWTATDGCGNSNSITITMVFVDTLAPVFTSVPADTTIQCGDAVPPFGAALAEDACGQVLISATQDTVTAPGGYDLVRTYTAVDDCGNTTTATQVVHVLNASAPILTGVPGDTTIYSTQGGTVPPPPDVKAWDGCTGDSLAVTFQEMIAAGNNGCDTLITRIWSAVDGAGNVAADTQYILVVSSLQVSAVVDVDTCSLGTGGIWLMPDTLSYLWNDGFVGAHRDSLPAGDYTIYFGSGTCSDTLTLSVPAVCPCIAPVLDSLTLVDAGCGQWNGEATIHLQADPALYNYLWLPNHGTPNAAGNARTGLPAGKYVVIVEQPGQDSCLTKVEFTIGDDCPSCSPLFEQDSMTTHSANDPATVCIPVPWALSQQYDIYLDGNPYTQGLGQCMNDSVVFYTYALVTGQGSSGPYDVTWVHGADTLMTTVNDMNELVAAMNAVDTAGMWYNQPDLFGLASMNTAGNYGDMYITHVASQTTAMISPNLTTTPMGTELTIGAGTHQVVYVNPDDGCADTLTVIVLPAPPLPGDIFFEKLIVESGNCDYADLSTCLDIGWSDLPNYDFFLNGETFNGTFEVCSYQHLHYYTYATIPGLGLAGPYLLEDWSIDGQHFNGSFQDVKALVALMNQLDPDGAWQVDEQAFLITGGADHQYGPLKVRQASTGAAALLEVNTNTIPGPAKVQLPEGENQFVAVRKADGLRDTLQVMVACVHADYFDNVILQAQVDTICLDLQEIMGEVSSLENICQSNSGAAQLELIPGTWCLRCTGMQPGEISACYVLCDEYGICDTTYLDIEVRAVAVGETRLVADTLVTLLGQPVQADVLANDELPATPDRMEIVMQPEHGVAYVNSDRTVTYVPAPDYCNDFEQGIPDRFFYEVCVGGECFTSVVWVQVRCTDLVIHNGFSPNGDGVNDFFVIEGLQRHPNHTLVVFNRWGNAVFRSKDYHNDWGGTWGQNDLPDGTYFYILELGDGQRLTGFVEIRR